MARLGDLVQKVRSKNAGPFWLTIDIFCGDATTFQRVDSAVSSQQVAELLQQPVENVKRFAMPNLNVVKFSIPRPQVQGSRLDRDMHGAQWALLVDLIEVD